MKSKKVLWTTFNEAGAMQKVCASLEEHVSKDLEVVMVPKYLNFESLGPAIISYAANHGIRVVAIRSNMLVTPEELEEAHAAGLTIIRRNTRRTPTGCIVFSKKTQHHASVYNLADDGWTEILEIQVRDTPKNMFYNQRGRDVTPEIAEGWQW